MLIHALAAEIVAKFALQRNGQVSKLYSPRHNHDHKPSPNFDDRHFDSPWSAWKGRQKIPQQNTCLRPIGDGKISLDEFTGFAFDERPHEGSGFDYEDEDTSTYLAHLDDEEFDEEITKQFEAADKDKNGFLTFDELNDSNLQLDKY